MRTGHCCFFLVVNPQQEGGIQRSLYFSKFLFTYLLLPLFIFSPLPYLKKWKNIELSKTSIFLGAALSVNYYFAFLIYGNYYLDQFWQIEGLLWVAGTFIPAFLIYLGIALCQEYLNREQKSKLSHSLTDIIRNSPVSCFVLIICLLVFCLPSILIVAIGDTETCGGFNIYSINQSQISNRTVIHLTDQDFRNFPRMAPVIRDNKTNSGDCYGSRYEGYTCAGEGRFKCNEQIQFHQYRENILEYNGRYYIMIQSTAV
jgi:hypothetical protein